jgi:HPt (histidine-containing phosphotransfer) domain-containing protein
MSADWPARLPGLDINKALNQLGQKKALLVKLLGMFKNNHSQDATPILAAFNAGNWEELHALNHALKGVSGNLAADALYQLCIEIDAGVKSGNHDIGHLVNQMPTVIAELLNSIDELLALPLE